MSKPSGTNSPTSSSDSVPPKRETREAVIKGNKPKEKREATRLTESFDLAIFSQDIYCGGYSGEDPPLPIPNREVKLTIADGTAPPGGRVGSCHFLIRHPVIIR